jgi:hypothetical protein
MGIKTEIPIEYRYICQRCTVWVAPPICQLAVLENDLARKPTTADTMDENINVKRIPVGCPNGYVKPPVFALREPDKPL